MSGMSCRFLFLKSLWLCRAGKPPSELCLGKGSGLDCLVTEREDIKTNRITPPIKPLRDGWYLIIARSL